MTKFARYSAYYIGGLLCILFLIGFTLFATETGSRFLVNRYCAHLPNDSIKSIHGTLISGLKLAEVKHEYRKVIVHINTLEFAWHPLALVKGTIHLSHLQMNGVTMVLPSKEAAAPLLEEVSLPAPVIIFDSAKLEDIRFFQGDKSYHLDYIHLSGRAKKKEVSFEKLVAHGKDMHIALHGRSGLSHPYPFDISINWRVTPHIFSKPLKGSCLIRGDIETATTTFKLASPFGLATNAELTANKDGKGLTVVGAGQDPIAQAAVDVPESSEFPRIIMRHVLIETFGGTITLNGSVALKSKPVSELSILGKNISPGKMVANWPGRLDFQTEFHGELSDNSMNVRLRGIELLGRLADWPVKVSGNINIQNNFPKLLDLDIRTGKNEFRLAGGLDEDTGVQLDLEVIEPQNLWPGLMGRWRGKGIAKQEDGNLTYSMVVEGEDVAYGNFRAKRYDGNFFYDPALPQNSHAEVKLSNLQIDSEVFPSVSIDWSGDLKKHRVQVDLSSATAYMNLDFQGACDADKWTFRIDDGTIGSKKHGKWRLRGKPANLVLQHLAIAPFNTDWCREGASGCMQVSWNGDAGWKVECDLDNSPLNQTVHSLTVLIQKPKLDKKYYKSREVRYRGIRPDEIRANSKKPSGQSRSGGLID